MNRKDQRSLLRGLAAIYCLVFNVLAVVVLLDTKFLIGLGLLVAVIIIYARFLE